MKTDFQARDRKKNVVIRVKPKGKRFAVTIPGKLSVNKRRTEIGFSRTEPFGIDPRFASHLLQVEQLAQPVTTEDATQSLRKKLSDTANAPLPTEKKGEGSTDPPLSRTEHGDNRSIYAVSYTHLTLPTICSV